MFDSVVAQFLAPPLTFLVFHVVLHVVSRQGIPGPIWPLLNAGVHLSVMAASVQFATTMYYVKLAAPTAPAAHREAVLAALPSSLLLVAATFVSGVIVALLDRSLHARHQLASTAGSAKRQQLTWAAASVLVPTVVGFVVFGVVAAKILAGGLMPDVH